MTKSTLIARIERLSPEAFEKLAPRIESELDLFDQLPALRKEIALAEKSIEDHGLIPHDEVMARIRENR